MRYRTDPKTGKEISALGFGCMRLPFDSKKAEKLIMSAIENGVNFFDTAYVYGNSETVLGNILHKNGAREKVYIMTKAPFNKLKMYNDFDKMLQTQLARLKTDYIDYYLLHNISELRLWENLKEIGIEKWIEEKKQSGQIRGFGFSFHGSRGDFLSLIGAYVWDICLIQYNYLDENYQAGRAGLCAAHERNIPVAIMEPLLGGKLAKGLPPKAVTLFKEIDKKKSPASWAFKWLYNQPEVTVVLSGMNAMEQLTDNLSAAEDSEPGVMTEAEAAVYEPVKEEIKKSYKIPCTGCNYCMPCPQKVNIPGCFTAYNASFSFGYLAGLAMYLTGLGMHQSEKKSSGRCCTKCGACEGKCPQRIDIPGSLETISKRMEPPWVRVIITAAKKIMS